MLKNQTLLQAKTKILKAMAHPSRLYIIEELTKSEKCVCQFVQEINADFSTVSKHLLVLKNAGLIDSDKRGQQVFYRLKLHCINNFLSCVQQAVLDNDANELS